MANGSPPFAATLDPVLRVGTRTEQSDALPKKRVRIEEVARLAGVSPITVSRALHNPHIVSEARRLRIDKAVIQTGYASNPHARALKSGKSNIVAAFLSTLASQQYTQAADGCARVLEDAGYHVVMGRTFYSYARETPLIRALMDMRPAAAFITGVMELEENRSFLRNLKIPIVESWANASDPIDMLAGFSNVDGVALIVEHLAARGYREIGFLGRSSGRGLIRQNAFEHFARQHGLNIVEALSLPNVSSVVDGRKSFRLLIESAPEIDAVFCANDLLGIGAMLESRTMGLTMPDDLAIVSFGDSDVAAALSPGMTTVSVDTYALGAAAGQMILSRLNGDEPDSPTQIFPVTLIHRGSS